MDEGRRLDHRRTYYNLIWAVGNELRKIRKSVNEAPIINKATWVEDKDCVGEEDPVTMDSIPEGQGFRLQAENRCYNAVTLAEMSRLNRPLVGPMTRIPFTKNDITRINEFRRANPGMRATGGKKRKTRKIRKNRKPKNIKRVKKNTKRQN